ncbi:MAG: DUF6152 family protein [Rhodospirillales bacterium]|nr:DUF6152 family protein [Rhodospirillales bacterium]
MDAIVRVIAFFARKSHCGFRIRQCIPLAAALAFAPAAAHHANSAFDRNATVRVGGTVTRWQFINPHAGLWFEVRDDDGNTVEWSAEFQGTLDLYRHFQFNKDTFLPGDSVTIVGYPARNGDPTMSTRIVIFADGREVDVRSAPD